MCEDKVNPPLGDIFSALKHNERRNLRDARDALISCWVAATASRQMKVSVLGFCWFGGEGRKSLRLLRMKNFQRAALLGILFFHVREQNVPETTSASLKNIPLLACYLHLHARRSRSSHTGPLSPQRC